MEADFTYDTLRKGTNGLVCYDRSGMPLQQPFAVQCTSVGNLPREAQNLKAEATGDRAKSEAMLKEMEQNGTRAKPEFAHAQPLRFSCPTRLKCCGKSAPFHRVCAEAVCRLSDRAHTREAPSVTSNARYV